LQQALSSRRTSTLVYCIFDVVDLEGYDLRQAELEKRKALLRELLARNENTRLLFVDHVVGGGPQFFEHCRQLGLEGSISKRRAGAYRSGRTDEWLKCKSVQSEPFVIGGYTTPQGQNQLRALVLGYHDDRGRLVYAGRVGSGIDDETFVTVQDKLRTIGRPTCPFAEAPPKEAGRVYHWVRPQLVAQVRYAGWSSDDLLWHPTFEGLRDDTAPTDIVRESVAGPARSIKEQASNVTHPPRSANPATPKALPQFLRDELAGVKLTHPGRVLYPDAGLTKLDLVKYYVAIADWVLPHLTNRLLNLVRCPDGVGGEAFYQKHGGHETPEAIGRVLIEEKDGPEQFLYVRDLKGLVSLVQVSVLEIHPWGARIDKLERPDRMVFDLDPDPAVPFSAVIQGAVRIKERLHDVGLTSFVKTTGGKGLHVIAPLERRQSWDDLKRFTQRLAQGLASDYPQSYTASMAMRDRPGRIYLDYVRNSRGATAIGAYSTRARPGAPVATPVAWDELTLDLRGDLYNVKNLPDRLMSLKADPWADMGKVRQALTPAMLAKL
jgi:bifunctional non-homologous end joining protein LigD